MALPIRVMQAISINHGGSSYPSLIVDFTEGKELVVGIPTERGEEVFFEKDERITVDLTLPDGIRRFDSVVRRRVPTSPPSLVLDWPASTERIQRREHVRVDVLLKVEVELDGPPTAPARTLSGFTSDLSAGGARVTLPEPIDPGTAVELRLHPKDRGTLEARGRVVRWGEKRDAPAERRYWIAIEFSEIDEGVRRDITKFVFDVQREQIRKGIA